MGMVMYVTMLLVMAALSSGQELSSNECENLGFTGLAFCSDCKAFAEHVKDQELESDCLKCCAEDSDDSMSKVTYAGALLEVCMRMLAFYPEIVGFIEEEKGKFPSVKVQYSFNSPPKMIMLDDNGAKTEQSDDREKFSLEDGELAAKEAKETISVTQLEHKSRDVVLAEDNANQLAEMLHVDNTEGVVVIPNDMESRTNCQNVEEVTAADIIARQISQVIEEEATAEEEKTDEEKDESI